MSVGLALSRPAGLRSLAAELGRRQPELARAGWLSLGVLIACLVAMTIDPRLINGVSVWTKPAKFAASFVAWFWTLAWAWGVLSPAARRGAVARAVLWGTLAAAGFEQGWITLRGALGQPSHFATDPLGAVLYKLMGVGALTLVGLAAVLGLLVLLRGDTAQPRPWRLAVGWGLVLAGALGGLTGATISAFGGPVIGGTPSDAGALPPFFWSRDGGDLRAAHFLGIHAMQAVPALALLLRRPRPAAIALGAAAWAAMALGAYAAALAGLPLSP
jgi:hypothetical protein